MIIPLVLGTIDLAAKLAPIVAQAVVDVIQTVHEHAQKTSGQASAVGLPMREVLNQGDDYERRMMAAAAIARPGDSPRAPAPGRS